MAMTRLTIEIEEDLKRQAKAKAYEEGYTLKEKINRLITSWLQSKKEGKNDKQI